MTQDSSQIPVAARGELYIAETTELFPGDTTDPSDHQDPDNLLADPGAAWRELGYTTREGVGFTIARTVNPVEGWQSPDPLLQIVEAIILGLDFSLLQLNSDTMPFAFGGGEFVEPSTGIYLFEPPELDAIDERAFILDFHSRGHKMRFGFPVGTVTGESSISLTRGTAAPLPVHFSPTRKDADSKGFFFASDHPALAPPAS